MAWIVHALTVMAQAHMFHTSDRIERIRVRTVRVPTEAPESDGTLRWDATTAVICEIEAGGTSGIGYTYAHPAAARVIEETLQPALGDTPASEIKACWQAMRRSVRNIGEPGIAAMAISAVDVALWDWLSRRVGLPLNRVLGACRSSVPAYGSGGFTSYSNDELAAQVTAFKKLGFGAFKMKVGRHPENDIERVRVARDALGEHGALYVDANGAYGRRQALELGEAFAELGVTWFEEPVSSEDVVGLSWLRDRCPPRLRIAAGEYGYRLDDFKRLLDAGAVDVLMADATRCGGVTGFMQVAALAAAYHVPLSSHCAPTLHAQLGCATLELESAEYFHDHVRAEARLFARAATVKDGALAVDVTAPGLGIAFDPGPSPLGAVHAR